MLLLPIKLFFAFHMLIPKEDENKVHREAEKKNRQIRAFIKIKDNSPSKQKCKRAYHGNIRAFNLGAQL